ncbi:MAG: 4'-phosphopantetheinyl transferase superfamily protein [Planctomycetes bacterium]|nr:4'-phosphopantetheinyl transferase superfamily protein [Planctomycetota bacterium]
MSKDPVRYLSPVVHHILECDSLRGAERVALQRRIAREALLRAAELCSAPTDGWQQDANRVPLPNDGWYWSISHKPLMAGAVISREPVGIDIEYIKPRGREDLWDRLANAGEWEVAGERSWEMFFRLWTAKEATLKANSRGISGFEECRIVAVPDETHIECEYGGQQWHIEQYYHAEHIAAVTAGSLDVQWHVVEL